MPSGGYRPNAGRPRGAKKRPELRADAVMRASASAGVTPLDYLLSIVRDPEAPADLRLRAAAIAAPFCHARPARGGKKGEAEEAARSADRGTDWEKLLRH